MDKEELIKKFLENKCTAEEAALVEKVLEQEPHLAEALLHQDEWDTAVSDVKADVHLKQEIWDHVAGRTKKPTVYRSLLQWSAIAASILLVVATVLYVSSPQKTTEIWSKTFSSADSMRITENHTAQIMELKLPDGSLVTLYPGATIQYNPDFSEQRNIHLLAGKAGFDVAKATQPFIVLSGNISTTALGTKFIVDQTGGKINVRLYEGKVLVKPVKNTAYLPPTILSPGKQCIINAQTNNYIIASLNNESFESVIKDRKTLATVSPENIGSGLEFYNVSLSEAFEQLETLFNKRIDYNAAETEKMYFTGKFTGKDSLDNILEIIMSVNGLKAQYLGGNIKIMSAPGPVMQDKPALNIPVEKEKTTSGKKVMNYENELLEKVFTDMERNFSINIQYKENDIKGKYFTGTVSPQDSPGKILAIICKMNQLQIIENPAGYQVMK